MKLTAFGATKKNPLHTDSPQNNQNTAATKAKKTRTGYNFRGGATVQFLLNAYIST